MAPNQNHVTIILFWKKEGWMDGWMDDSFEIFKKWRYFLLIG
jgi:hypothetical protein